MALEQYRIEIYIVFLYAVSDINRIAVRILLSFFVKEISNSVNRIGFILSYAIVMLRNCLKHIQETMKKSCLRNLQTSILYTTVPLRSIKCTDATAKIAEKYWHAILKAQSFFKYKDTDYK